MAQQPRPTVPPSAISLPPDVTSPRAKLLLVALALTEDASERELCRCLELSPLSLYPLARELRAAGHVQRASDGSLRLPADVLLAGE